jgi:hypothetical protein
MSDEENGGCTVSAAQPFYMDEATLNRLHQEDKVVDFVSYRRKRLGLCLECGLQLDDPTRFDLCLPCSDILYETDEPSTGY